MRPLHELIILNHFYYCFLLAIKIRKCNLLSFDDAESKIFIKNWLSKARERQLFDKLAHDEIRWLQESISENDMTCLVFEFNIELIYRRSLEMINEEELKFKPLLLVV